MDAFNAAQPSYISAILNPKVLADYKPKMKKFKGVPIPKWLDYCCFGPPAVRDSSPGGMALIFGRTEHDTKYYPKGKGKALRAFNAIFLICMYICFLYVPFHMIYKIGIKPYRQSLAAAASIPGGDSSDCKAGMLRPCPSGCSRPWLFRACEPDAAMAPPASV